MLVGFWWETAKTVHGRIALKEMGQECVWTGCV